MREKASTGSEPTARVEEYLESVINLQGEGKAVLAARLAERLNLTPPTVSATLHRMERDGLIVINERKEIVLTEKGKKLAFTILRRHRLAERLLADVLGLEWHSVHEEACLLEHSISARVEERLYEILNRPMVCPHGNPIPHGDSLPPPKGVPLGSVVQGISVAVERVSEEATRNPQLMKFLSENGIIPGALFKVKEITPGAGTITLSTTHHEVTLSLNIADMVWVTPQTSP